MDFIAGQKLNSSTSSISLSEKGPMLSVAFSSLVKLLCKHRKGQGRLVIGCFAEREAFWWELTFNTNILMLVSTSKSHLTLSFLFILRMFLLLITPYCFLQECDQSPNPLTLPGSLCTTISWAISLFTHSSWPNALL